MMIANDLKYWVVKYFCRRCVSNILVKQMNNLKTKRMLKFNVFQYLFNELLFTIGVR